MNRLRLLALIVGLAASSLSDGCAHVQPVINAVVTCSGNTIPLSLVKTLYTDVMAEDWADIATNVVPLLKDGWADVDCILGYLAVSNPETSPHIQKFKAYRATVATGSGLSSSKLSPGSRSHATRESWGYSPLVWL